MNQRVNWSFVMGWPNERDAGNGAIALLFHIESFVRAVPDHGALDHFAHAYENSHQEDSGSLRRSVRLLLHCVFPERSH